MNNLMQSSLYNVIIRLFVTPEEGKFYVLPDQFAPKWNFRVRASAPAPAINRTGEMDEPSHMPRAILTEEWQWFWADLLALQKYGKVYRSLSGTQKRDIQRAFSAMTGSHTAFTNNAGSDKCRNYVKGEIWKNARRTILRPVMRMDPLLCAHKDTTHYMAGEKTINSQGKWVVRVHGFNALEKPPVATLAMLKDPRVQYATNISTRGTLSNFDQLKANGMPVPYPIMQSKPTYYYLEDLAEIS